MLALLLVFGSVIFFALAEQAGSSLNQFSERNTALPHATAFWTITPAQTQSFNAGYILIFAPLLAWLWAKLGQQGRDPNPLVKFGLGAASRSAPGSWCWSGARLRHARRSARRCSSWRSPTCCRPPASSS